MCALQAHILQKEAARIIRAANGINQFTFWGELVFSLPKSANNPFSKGLAF